MATQFQRYITLRPPPPKAPQKDCCYVEIACFWIKLYLRMIIDSIGTQHGNTLPKKVLLKRNTGVSQSVSCKWNEAVPFGIINHY